MWNEKVTFLQANVLSIEIIRLTSPEQICYQILSKCPVGKLPEDIAGSALSVHDVPVGALGNVDRAGALRGVPVCTRLPPEGLCA